MCSRWISSGIARDLNDLRRVHQLLVSSLQKLSGSDVIHGSQKSTSSGGVAANDQHQQQQQFSMQNSVSNDQLIYSELSLTIEKLAVLRSWAEVYIVAQRKSIPDKEKKSTINASTSETGLLSLVQPELPILSYHWSVALKDYAFLCLPSGNLQQIK